MHAPLELADIAADALARIRDSGTLCARVKVT
jgi:hypothetical protein